MKEEKERIGSHTGFSLLTSSIRGNDKNEKSSHLKEVDGEHNRKLL